MRAAARREHGQGTVELVALLPLIVTVALAAAQLLAAGVARELAAHAAENGAIALADGESPTEAVKEALPGWARDAVRVRVTGRQVRVRLQPVTVFPGAGRALASEARADAGPGAGAADEQTSSAAGVGAAAGLGAVSAPTRDDPGASFSGHADVAAARTPTRAPTPALAPAPRGFPEGGR